MESMEVLCLIGSTVPFCRDTGQEKVENHLCNTERVRCPERGCGRETSTHIGSGSWAISKPFPLQKQLEIDFVHESEGTSVVKV